MQIRKHKVIKACTNRQGWICVSWDAKICAQNCTIAGTRWGFHMVSSSTRPEHDAASAYNWLHWKMQGSGWALKLCPPCRYLSVYRSLVSPVYSLHPNRRRPTLFAGVCGACF